MGSNLDEGHAKCVGESSHPKTSQASNYHREPMPPYFLKIYYLYDPFTLNMVNQGPFESYISLITKFMSPPQPRELVSW